MKFLKRLTLSLCLIYVLFWGSLAAYFSYAEQHEELLEGNLSRIFGRPVTIDEIKTVWNGLSPSVQINGFNIASDVAGESALAFDSMSAELSPSSLLLFWPRLTEFAVERPVVEIVSLGSKKLQIAGVELKPNDSLGFNPKRLVSWLMNHESATWLNGEIVWRRPGGIVQHYRNISFVYEREQQDRNVSAAGITPKGAVAFQAQVRGNPLSDLDWDASVETLGNQGKQILSSDDLSLNVQDGMGQLRLKTLDVERIRDLILLTGLADNFNWLLDAQLAGRLHDVEFNFSGALLEFTDWSLLASASGVGFKSTGQLPAMNNLRGQLNASADGGQFLFFSKNAVFEWSRWFDYEFPITEAKGEFAWRFGAGGEIVVSLTDGEIVDQNTRIRNINASCKFDQRDRKISNFAEVFTAESVASLDFQDDDIDAAGVSLNQRTGPLVVDASAEFAVDDFSVMYGYLPKGERLKKFRTWAKNAFLAGRATNGKLSYRGELSKNAIHVGKAELEASADFNSVEIDYGYQRSWPKVNRGIGKATLKNNLLDVTPEHIYLDKYALNNSDLQIVDLFKKNRYLKLHGETQMDLPDGMEFLLRGPLIAPDRIPEKLPVDTDQGTLDLNLDVILPLRNLAAAEVTGTAEIKNGRAWLPSKVPLNDVSALIEFTERSVRSDNIKATFLGGDTTATLVTTEQAQPPVVRLSASGLAEVERLSPWVGEHLLTWFNGKTPWEGQLLIDGGKVVIEGKSQLEGVAVSAPAPLAKTSEKPMPLSLFLVTGNNVQQQLEVNYGDIASAQLRARSVQGQSKARDRFPSAPPSLLDQVQISIGEEAVSQREPAKPGVNFDVTQNDINLDQWLSSIIELAEFEPKNKIDNTVFLDAMRNVEITAENPFFLGRRFGALAMSAISVDGAYWIGSLNGENISGTMKLQPRETKGNYEFNLNYLSLDQAPEEHDRILPPIDYSLRPESYPTLALTIERFRLTGKSLGRLELKGEAVDDRWQLSNFDMVHRGIKTTATGSWMNNPESGSITSFDFETKIDEAEGVLGDMSFDGFIRKGDGSIKGNVNWRGAPHEFEYGRLNGDFDIRISDGELVKVEPGGGKLLGLLNFNAIARRLTFDFRDVFASGLTFDRMRYTGFLSEGEAIMSDAFIFTPAVYVRMEGKINLPEELIDMEIHISPELGGNLTLLSALANPAAGAVVYLTQRIFKDEVRNSSFKSFRALGTWEDFEMVEFEAGKEDPDARAVDSKKSSTPPILPEQSSNG